LLGIIGLVSKGVIRFAAGINNDQVDGSVADRWALACQLQPTVLAQGQGRKHYGVGFYAGQTQTTNCSQSMDISICCGNIAEACTCTPQRGSSTAHPQKSSSKERAVSFPNQLLNRPGLEIPEPFTVFLGNRRSSPGAGLRS